MTNKERALNILLRNLNKTGWNYFQDTTLKSMCGVTNKELNELYQEGKISVRKGINHKLIILNETKAQVV